MTMRNRDSSIRDAAQERSGYYYECMTSILCSPISLFMYTPLFGDWHYRECGSSGCMGLGVSRVWAGVATRTVWETFKLKCLYMADMTGRSDFT